MEWKGVIVYLNRKIVLFTWHFFFHDKKKKSHRKIFIFYWMYFILLFEFFTSNAYQKLHFFFIYHLSKYHLHCPFFCILFDWLFFNISTKNYEIPMEKNFRNNFLLFQIYLFLNCVSQDTSDLSVIWNLKSLVVDRPCTWQLFSTYFYVERPHCPSLTIVYSK